MNVMLKELSVRDYSDTYPLTAREKAKMLRISYQKLLRDTKSENPQFKFRKIGREYRYKIFDDE